MTHTASAQDVTIQSKSGLRGALERLFLMTPAMLHSIDMQGRLIAVSDDWLTQLGYSRQEVLGKLSSSFLTPESRDHAISRVLPEFFRQGRCENVEYQMVCKGGRVIDVLMSAILDKGANGQQPTSLAVVTDVTARKAAELKLAESERRYKGLVEDQSEMVSLATPDGELRFVNHAYARLHNTQPNEMSGKNLLDYVPEEHRSSVARHLQTICSHDHSVEYENQVCLPDGQARWISWTNRALADATGKVTLIHSVGRDINRRVAVEQRLKESEARYRLLAEYSADMVFQLDLGLVRNYVSPACREVLGYEPEEMIGVGPVSMMHPEDAERVAQILRSLLDGRADRHTVINRIRHRDGRWIWVEAQLRTLRNQQTGVPEGIIGALRDISARKAIEDQLAEAHRRLEVLAGQDGLTGLPNRRIFDGTLSSEHRRARREKQSLALVMIDVDWFKPYNDRYGHPAGDDCLKQIGRIISDAIRRAGDIVARYGGEEFVVILANTDEFGAAVVGERIRQAISLAAIPHDASPNRIVTISLGVASLAHDACEGTPETLLHEADRALYRAKSQGRNTVGLASELSFVPVAQPSNHALA